MNPEDYFDHFNVAVHGITESDVVNESLFSEVYKELSSLVTNQIVVHHTAFDKVAINAVCKKYKLKPPNLTWIDSVRVVRRVYPVFISRGYGLKNLTNHFGIKFKHHDAEGDAIATHKIVNHCLVDSKTEIEHWRENQFRSTQSTKTVGGGVIGFIDSKVDSNGNLFGETSISSLVEPGGVL
ncbi:MAG: hypothetical protein COA49_06005 [Bacteroidetes bacterium]|nr:MAG: hypothetical protein COA49_06005 [Bacteroidota bacterium]